MNRLPHLEVKFAEISAEVRIIRQKEQKYKKWAARARAAKNREQAGRWAAEHMAMRDSLYEHRVFVVRPAARAAHLALGYLRGVPYRRMEFKAREQPDFKHVWHNILIFGSRQDTEEERKRFEDWLDVPAEEAAFNHNSGRDYAQFSHPSTFAKLQRYYK